MDPHPGPLPTPRLDPGLRVGQVGEALPGPEVAAHVLHRPLDPRLVLRRAHPGRVSGETDVLGVVQPALAQLRVDRVGVGDHRLHVVGDQDLEAAAEERPGRLTTGDHRGQRLRVGQPHEHVPAEHRGEDQRVHPPRLPGLRVHQQTQLREVELALHPRRPVRDPDRARPDPKPALRHREPVQRPVRHPHPPPGQQLLDLHDAQRVPPVTSLDPGPDLLLMCQQQLPRLAVPVRACRTDRVDDLADELVGDRAHARVADQPSGLGRGDVPASGLAVHPRPLGRLPQPRSLQPRTQHLTHLNHADLPESHARRPPRSPT